MLSTNKSLWLAGAAALFLFAWSIGGCEMSDTGDGPQTGTIGAASALPGPVQDVTAIRFKVVKALQECAAEPVAMASVPLEEEMLPDFLLPEGVGDSHPFADELFVLEPGQYKVCAMPLQEDDSPSEACEGNWAWASVLPGMTSEIFILMQCEGWENGALDVGGVLNTPPIIEDLEIEDSKFITVCETAEITVTATDMNGDEIEFEWSVLSSPNGSTYDLTSDDNMAWFSADTPGTYMLRVVAYDITLAATSLKFPIHVSDAECDSGVDTGGDAASPCPPCPECPSCPDTDCPPECPPCHR